MGFTVIVTAPSLAAPGLDLLKARGCVVHYIKATDDSAALGGLLASQPIDAIISRTLPITRTMMESCPTLKVISKHGTGTSNIDVDAASELGIAVFSTPGANARAVAEFTLALMLASLRHVVRFDRAIRAGTWDRCGDGLGFEGRQLGLVGYGRIAQQVGQMAAALGMKVSAYDPIHGAGQRSGVELVETLDALLPRADILSLHCPAKPGAPPLLNAEALSRLPQGAILVNTARGELIDEAALVESLQCGQLSVAALDTFMVEPLTNDNPLRLLDNVVLTPHVGGSTPEALSSMARGAAENVIAYLDSLSCERPERTSSPLPDNIAANCLNAQAMASNCRQLLPYDVADEQRCVRAG